jgi:aminopeptidase N
MIERPAKSAWIAANRPLVGPVFDAMNRERKAAAAFSATPEGRRQEAAAKAAKAADHAKWVAELVARAEAKEAAIPPAVRAAAAQYDRAQQWPRCGERWPMTAEETAADALLKSAKAGPYA